MSNVDVNSGKALNMFLRIRDFELKNVRTGERDGKEMVKILTNYILKTVAEDTKAGDRES